MNAPVANILPAEALLPNDAWAPPLEKQRVRLYALQFVTDGLLILWAHSLAALTYLDDALDDRTLRAGAMLGALYLTIALYNGVYTRVSLRNWKAGGLRMAGALALSAALFSLFAFFAKSNAHFSRGTFALGLANSFILMLTARMLLSEWSRRHLGHRLANVLVIHDGGPPLSLPHVFQVSAADCSLSPSLADPHGLDRLGYFLRNMDRVVVSCAPERRVEWSLVLKGTGVNGEIVSDSEGEVAPLGVQHYGYGSRYGLVVSTGPLGLRDRAIKRLLDLVFAGLALIVLSPLLALIALLVTAQDGGPAIFRQRRLGRGNRFFSMYKFRTMKVSDGDEDGHRSTSRDDDRVTRIGRFLRRTSLDELPQLINVVLGQMSIVGPRPHAIGSHAGDKYFWEVDHRYWERHSLKPGLTGLAQVRGLRGATPEEIDLHLRLQADLEYLNGWSVWRDLAIICATARVLVHHRAY